MMPTPTYPWALLLLALVPLLVWRHACLPRAGWRYSDLRLLPENVGGRARRARRGGLLLRALGLTLLVVALAGPRWIDERERLPTEGISIVMIVDVSVSMGHEDFAWQDARVSRLVGVKKLFRLFVAGGKGPDDIELPGRPHDLIALVPFATRPETACPLTLDHQALLEILDAQEPRTGAEEGTTNPGDALAWGLHVLRQAPTRRKAIVFLTDGESNVPGKLKARPAAQLAANLAIPIYAIDASPAEAKDKEEADEARRAKDTLESLARMTDGAYFRAADGRGLSQAYEKIDRLERDKILSFQYRRYYEGFHWFALASFVVWLTLIALEATYWRRVP
ncbi:MAG: VWA domain-containing protein [Planctomycetes bacterium]|nr:VWA domain-containing protein [Planctomycetota bacterium]